MGGLEFAAIARSIGIRGGAIIALVLLCIFLMIRAHTISGQRDDERDGRANERAAHAITRASARDLEHQLSKFIGAGKAARVRQVAAIEAQAKDSTRLQRAADRIRAEMAAIKPEDRDPCDCTTSGSILSAEGL